MNGVVTKIQTKNRIKRSYGFIRGNDGNDYYFNLFGLSFDFSVGDEVIFTGERNEKGFIARDVSVVTESNVHV